MGINLNCDECGRFIRHVKVAEIAKMNNDEETICEKCIKRIEFWHKKIDGAGHDAISSIKTAILEARGRFDKVMTDKRIQDGRK